MFMLLFLPHVAFQAGSALGSALACSTAVQLMGVSFALDTYFRERRLLSHWC